jgi:ribosomal protein S16
MNSTIATPGTNDTVKSGQIAPIYIYALTDPDGTPRYVGQSNNPHARLSNHTSQFAAPAVRDWVTKLREQGQKPGLCLLYRVTETESAEEAEKRFIRELGTVGNLLNFRPGKREGVVPAAQKLRDWLHEQGATQTDFARMLTTDQSVVSRWINGTRVPGVRSALKIQRATGIDPELWLEEAA